MPANPSPYYPNKHTSHKGVAWFGGYTLPAYTGWYERKYPFKGMALNYKYLDYWDGRRWWITVPTELNNGTHVRVHLCDWQHLPWRGSNVYLGPTIQPY